MRFNEKELVSLSRQPSEKAAELGMRGPKKGDGNTVYFTYCYFYLSRISDHWRYHTSAVCVISVPFCFHAVVKKRLVKLVVNFLFYFRTDEEEVS